MRPGALHAVASYRVGGGTASAHCPMDRLTVSVEPFDHLDTAQLLIVEVEEHRLTLQDRSDLQVPALDPAVLRKRNPRLVETVGDPLLIGDILSVVGKKSPMR